MVGTQSGGFAQWNNYYPFGLGFGDDVGHDKQPYKFGVRS